MVFSLSCLSQAVLDSQSQGRFPVQSEFAMVKSVVLIPEYRQNARFQSKLSQLVGPWRKKRIDV